MILFACAAGKDIGWGHLSRCITLAEELSAKHEFAFFVEAGEDIVDHYLSDRGIKRVFSLENLKADICLVDVQTPDITLLHSLRQTGGKCVGLDVFVLRESFDILFQLLDHSGAGYPKEAIHEGLEFAIIRKDLHRVERRFDTIRDVLVIFGGSDSRGLSLEILQFLEKEAASLNIHVALGPMAEDIAFGSHRHSVTTYRNADLQELFTNADVAFSGAGTTCFELGFMGVPTIAVPQSRAEELMAAHLADKHLVLSGMIRACWREIQCQDTRIELNSNAAACFDGKGARRILHEIGVAV